MACSAVEWLGWIVLTVFVLKCLQSFTHFIYTSLIGSLLGHNIDLRKCGPWAVVTGATDGIGKAYAKQMANAGLNVVLISRTPAKLKSVADEIKAKYSNVQIKTIAVDFTEGHSIYPKLKAELTQLKIGILINNVGMLNNFGERFASDGDDRSVHDIINCNIMSMARMCHLVLPQMIKRKSGVIVNIGSLSSAMPTPMITIYGATKAFVEKFSMDLSAEVSSLGVTVQTVHPGYVYTNMAPIARSSLIAPEADTFAAAALKTLGLERRTGGYWTHKIQLVLGDALSYFVPRSMIEPHIIREMAKIRKETIQQLKKK